MEPVRCRIFVHRAGCRRRGKRDATRRLHGVMRRPDAYISSYKSVSLSRHRASDTARHEDARTRTLNRASDIIRDARPGALHRNRTHAITRSLRTPNRMRDPKKKSPASPRTCGACSAIAGGDGGIRTLDPGFGPDAPLAGECLRPLGHVSQTFARTREAVRRERDNIGFRTARQFP